MRVKNLILFGFKGCGKTHFGSLLSRIIERPFIDTDARIEALYLCEFKKRLSVSQIYRNLNEFDFRLLEKRALLTLASVRGCVIALGGGALGRDAAVDSLLKTIGTSVYLQASETSLQKRIFQNGCPALFDSADPIASFLSLYRKRKPLYEAIQAERIDTDALDEAAILKKLQQIALSQEGYLGF